jgi:prenyltransferase beta subunit/uncharacterized protein (DUF2141 family)
MARAMHGCFKLILSLFIFLLCALTANLASAIDVAWLSSQQALDGSFGSSNTVSTAFQATSEAIQTIYALGEASQQGIPAAIQYLEDDTFQSTEHLARKIIVTIASGQDTSANIGDLINRSGPDGGFGELPGYDSTAVDTAYALNALAVAGIQLNDAASNAIAYLLAEQNTDGSWSDGPNVSSIYVTALVSRALQSYRHHYVLNESIDRANSFLLSSRNTQGAIGDVNETALSIIALAPATYDQSIYQDVVDYLASLRLADGSWDNDVFTTALALRALNEVQSGVPIDPATAVVSGRVTDSVTRSPLANVEVSVNVDGQIKTSTTDARGLYVITGIQLGNLSLSARLNGYLSVAASGSVVAGQTLSFSPALARDPTPGLLHLVGAVSDGTDGSWLHSASVRILNTKYSTVTDTSGSFTLSDLPPGSYTVEISHTGYVSRIYSLSSPNGGNVNLGEVSLLPVNTDASTGTVRGQVTNSANGAPLKGVEVVLDGSDSKSTFTDDYGRFKIEAVTPGDIAFTVSLSGYRSATGEAVVNVNAVTTLNVSLLSEKQAASSTFDVTGHVVDATTLQPLQGAQVEILNTTFGLTVNANGSFEFIDIPAGAIDVVVTHAGYLSKRYRISAKNGGSVALGSVGLVQDNSSATTGAVKGKVLEAISGKPLNGVEISLSGADGQVVYSDVTGQFSVPVVTPGNVTISASMQDYRTSVATGEIVAGGILDAAMELVRTNDPTTVSITGSVADAQTLNPLSGVLVSLVSGGYDTQSDSDGAFILSGAPSGVFQVQLQLLGYNAITYTVSAIDGGLVDLGRISLAQDTPVSSNHAPVISSSAPRSGIAGLQYQYQVIAEDSDGDVLTYGISAYPAGMEIDPNSGSISWIPTTDQTGHHEYSVVVSDDKGAVATQDISVNIQSGSYPTYVITDVETLNGLVVDKLVPDNYQVGSYLSGGRNATWRAVSADGCGFAYTTEANTKANAAESLDFWAMGAGEESDAIWDMGGPFDVISVFPLIDHEPFPHEGIEYTVWGSNDPNATFPDEWKLATLVTIYGKGWADNSASCTEAINIDDYAGLYTFVGDSYRFVRLKADNSITIFDTPEHATFNSVNDEGVQPGWQSSKSEIDAIGGMVCDVKPVAEAGDNITGRTGDPIQFDGTASQGNIRSYGWDLDDDNEIDLSGVQPNWVFNAGFDQDITLYVVDDRGCVGTDTTHVTITLDVPKPDLTVSGFSREKLTTNLQTLQINGSVQVTVDNISVADAVSPAVVSVFEDTNQNGVYDPDDDNTLGAMTMPSGLPRNGSISMEVPVNGVISFRDSHLYAMVDSGRRIEESNEKNNLESTLHECLATTPQTGDLSLDTKWSWHGSSVSPTSYNVLGPPVVGQLSDDNNDGVIDAKDTPDLVFTSWPGGVLNVVSGDDGREIWTDNSHKVTGYGSAALGDIDGDGVAEIIVSNESRDFLLAFENDGRLKWSAPTGPHHPNITRDGIAIADLDHDGQPEIIQGRRVYSSDGTLRWDGIKDYAGEASYGFLSNAADVDGQGDMEVVAGRTLYDSTGNVLWHRSDISEDGFNAIGNFDEDEFAEIILVAGGKVYLLEHTGETKWGPVPIPGGGKGGAPTVGDFDGDGEPEIGVAGSSNYVVFETDGSIKWTARTMDYSSNRTGSSLFDFEADGSVEVLYADEQNFYVFDGKTGRELVNIPNGSGTTLEYPVVADIDNDGSAEVIVTSANHGFLGVRVFGSAGAGWAPTRSIWNQHAYHIDNINDDGTIPQYEKPSWLTHNTYRLNTFPDRDPLGLPDLSASRLKIIDNGAGQPLSITVRIGNSGAGPLPGESRVAFYQGNPGQGGILLGERTVSDMQAGDYQDVTLDNIASLSESADIFAVADADNHLIECNETNNRVVLPVFIQSLSGGIAVSTDSPAYGPDSKVALNVSITNISALPGQFIAKLQVVDQSGTPVITFDNREVGPLDGAEAISYDEIWNSQNTMTGTYRLKGELYALDGTLLDSSESLFDMRHAQDATFPKLNLRISTDKAIYNTTDQVRIDEWVQNLTTNNKIASATLHVRVTYPDASEATVTDIQLAELMPRGQRAFEGQLTLQNATEGSYQVVGQVISASGDILASDSAAFTVEEDTFMSLSGAVTVQAASVYQGRAEVCTVSIAHRGTLSIDSLSIRQVLVATDPEQQINTTGQVIALAAGDKWSEIRSIDTSPLDVGTYACVLQAEIKGAWETLAYAYFQVLEQPINIDAALGHGNHGRVLVLLDDDGEECSGVRELNIEVDIDDELEPDVSVVVDLLGKHGQLVDRERASLDARSVNAQVGTGGIDLSILDFSENHLSIGLNGSGSARGVLEEGYRTLATINWPGGSTRFDSGKFSTDCDHRKVELDDRHGDYRITSVDMKKEKHHSHENDHLPSLQVQRNFLGMLMSQSGWSYSIVTNKGAFKKQLRSGVYSTYMLLSERIKIDEKTQKELREAVYRGEGLLVASGHDQRQRRIDEALGIHFKGALKGMSDVELLESDLHAAATGSFALSDKKPRIRTDGAKVNGVFMSNAVQTQYPAVTTYDYGLGRSAYVGYDLLAEAALTGDYQSIHAQLILAGLSYVDYAPEVPLAGQAYPLRLSLSNQGNATSGRASIMLPENVLVLDSGGAMLTDTTTLTWSFDLGLDETLVFDTWLGLPQHTVDVQADVQPGFDPDYVDHTTASIQITSQQGLSAQDALDAIDAVDGRRYRKVKKYLLWAVDDVTSNCYEKALEALVRASDELIRIGTPESESIREIVASAIRTASLEIETASCSRSDHCSHGYSMDLH